MNREQIRQYLAFYRDLHVKSLNLAGLPQSPVAPRSRQLSETRPAESARAASPSAPRTAPPHSIVASRGLVRNSQKIVGKLNEKSEMISGVPGITPPNDSLAQIRNDIGDCKRCRLSDGRTRIVFGVGDENAKLVFVGEGPGADEDAQGVPFVGRAGQLLTRMIEGTAEREGIQLQRADVYICNVVKCRPPENRTPLPDEMETCGQFLFRQLQVLKPKAIVALGGTAAKALLARREGVTRMRGNWYKWAEIPVMVTYHPSYLLRPYNQNAKREAWEDLKKVLHFVYD